MTLRSLPKLAGVIGFALLVHCGSSAPPASDGPPTPTHCGPNPNGTHCNTVAEECFLDTQVCTCGTDHFWACM